MANKDEEKQKLEDDLDTETTFADMNIDGFKWYDAAKKSGKKMDGVKVTRKEKWAIAKAAFASLWPILVFIALLFGFLYLFARLWLG